MDFNQIRYFLALAESLNFTRAAEQCYVTQPALTQAIKRLEDELGGELVYRDGRDTHLTELGKRILGQFGKIDHAKHIIKATAKAISSGEVAELNIGIMCTIGPRVLSQLLDEFQKQHLAISVTLHDVDPDIIAEKLLSGELDGAFCARHGEPHYQLSYLKLFEEQMVIAFPSSHRFSSMDTVPLREISNQRYVDRVHCEFRDEFMTIFKKDNLSLDIAFSSQREDWIQSMIRDGVGVCLIPQYSLLQPELDYRPVTQPTISRSVEFAVFDQPAVSPALEQLIKHVREFNWRVPK